MRTTITSFLAALAVTGCDWEFWRPEPVALSILGYNYTGRYIHSFSVDGQWGGNLYDDSGGARVVCCLSFRPDSKLPFAVNVEWELNDIRDFENGKWIPAAEEHHKATVTVNGPLPANKPHSFEVHFMPDGSVQAYVTHFPSTRFFLADGRQNPDIIFAPPGDARLQER